MFAFLVIYTIFVLLATIATAVFLVIAVTTPSTDISVVANLGVCLVVLGYNLGLCIQAIVLEICS